MDIKIFLGLLQNIETLLILSILYQINSYFEHRFGRYKSLLNGLIIGLMGLFVMTYPYVFQSGLVFDTRSVLIASVALFFSTSTLLISSAMMVLYRIMTGGIGMMTGVSVIILTTVVGLLWRKYCFESNIVSRWLNIYLYGLLVHMVMMLTMYLLPNPVAIETVRSLGIPILILYPLTTLLISSLLYLQKKQNEALELIRDAEKKYSSLFNNDHTVMLLIDPKDMQIVDANPAAVNFYGWSKNELLLKKITDINVMTTDQILAEIDRAKKGNKNNYFFQHRTADGVIVDVEAHTGTISIKKKQLIYSIVIDISERVVAQAEMKRNIDLFRAVVESSPDAIFIQIDRRFSYLNPAALRLFDAIDETEMVGMRILDRVHPDYHEEVKHIMSEVNINRKAFTGSRRVYLTMEGKPIHVETVAVPIVFNGRSGALVITHDISSRLETQNALLRSEMNFRSVVKNMPIPIFIYQNGKFAFLNPAAIKFFGAINDENLFSLPLSDFALQENGDDDINEQIRLVCDEKTDLPLHPHHFVKMDGSRVLAEVGAVFVNYDGNDSALVFVRDLTEEIEMEKRKVEWEMQIQQKQRLESIGVLAGGVAHEVNNPINGIMNYAQLILEESVGKVSVENYGNQIIRESMRISDIVKSLLQFSRQEKQSHSYSSVYDIIENTLSLINVIIKKDQIELRIHMEENLPDIKCRSQQIQQVFMNLITNAKDSLNEKYPGYHESKMIEVDLRLKHHDERRWIYLSVKDYGMGVRDEDKARIFEPFYSTKPKEKGTGLGLAISFGIVEDHHGKILVDTVVGEYTDFTVVLPVDNGWNLT
ncbi:MAG: PAS domain S-box protein [Erysipelotrichaceae bacterium]|nr:PAS domain S-box protein [Erysipelotrichaceae bacterium]